MQVCRLAEIHCGENVTLKARAVIHAVFATDQRTSKYRYAKCSKTFPSSSATSFIISTLLLCAASACVTAFIGTQMLQNLSLFFAHLVFLLC